MNGSVHNGNGNSKKKRPISLGTRLVNRLKPRRSQPKDLAEVPVSPLEGRSRSPLAAVIKFCLHNQLIVLMCLVILVAWGLFVAPFNWHIEGVERNPVAVDAIPDIGENQQIVFTKWPGRSPQDIEDQVTYPLTVALTGMPGVKSVRSYSMFGFSSIYVIFEDDVDFYWSRTRVLEKLNALPSNSLPAGITPMLGPDSTALGQVFWYTLEPQDKDGNPTGGWDLDELRSVQDWTVRYALLSVKGVSEVASVGGYVREYQIDVDPDAMRAYHISMNQIYGAVKNANRDVGARTIEVNNTEYIIRGIGYIKSLEDIENSVITQQNNVPIYVKNVAKVRLGPAQRRGVLDKEGAETVGGVVVVRFGENPLKVIDAVKEKLALLAPSLPQKTLDDGTESQLKVVPFYDRSGLIYETLGTLNTALMEEILITIIVVLMMIAHFRIATVISMLLPVTVLLCFILMKLFHVDANIVALSGIAIAIGTIVDMGIVVCENIVKHLGEADERIPRLKVVYEATCEVAGAVLTAVSTTVISFLPVFTLQYAEGKLFRPLAYTKTFTLSASVVVALTLLPILTYLFLCAKPKVKAFAIISRILLVIMGLILAITFGIKAGWLLTFIAGYFLVNHRLSTRVQTVIRWTIYIGGVAAVIYGLTLYWLPLGPQKGVALNFLFVAGPTVLLIGLFYIFQYFYEELLRFCLRNKLLFMSFPVFVAVIGCMGWLGFDHTFSWLPDSFRKSKVAVLMDRTFPGLDEEFMPALDEGAFLFMPSIAYHGSVGEIKDVLSKQDMNIKELVPEVSGVVGKAGRAETPLDPAPLGMVETVINYHNEFVTDENGSYLKFKYDSEGKETMKSADGREMKAPDGAAYFVKGKFERDKNNQLIPDSDGVPFRQWRSAIDPDLNPGRKSWGGIVKTTDIWDDIVRVADITGSSKAYRLQPIETRIVMLQSGMKAKMGVKVKGTSLKEIEAAALEIEKTLKGVKEINALTVAAKRIQGKPYLEVIPNRKAIARYGVKLGDVLEVIEVGIGGRKVTATVEGRERYPVRIRFERERRDNLEAIGNLPISSPNGLNIPLKQLATIRYRMGAQNIISEDSFYMTFVSFGKNPGYADSEVIEAAKKHLLEKKASGEMKELNKGKVFYEFAGEYKNRVRANKRLMMIIPISLVLIFLILYLQFRAFWTTGFVFTGIGVAWSGGFIMLWLYSQSWFMNFTLFSIDMRELFQIQPINMSVAVWVGFLALFGIATDDGVVMATYIKEVLKKRMPETKDTLHEAISAAGKRRIRPCLMTTATTILALLPILTSTGKGADIMIPMAIPVFGGMVFEVITMLVVPVLFCMLHEARLKLTRITE